MSTTTNRAITFALLTILCLVQVSPAFAQFTGTGAQATNWFVQLVTPLIPLACAAVGVLCMTGRINWAWFGGALIGTALFFGRDQVVSMFRGWLSV